MSNAKNNVFVGGHVGVVAYLASHGAGLDLANAEGETALHIAAQKGHHDVAVELLRRGANRHALYASSRADPHNLSCFVRNNSGASPAEVARAAGHLQLSQFLSTVITVHNA